MGVKDKKCSPTAKEQQQQLTSNPRGRKVGGAWRSMEGRLGDRKKPRELQGWKNPTGKLSADFSFLPCTSEILNNIVTYYAKLTKHGLRVLLQGLWMGLHSHIHCPSLIINDTHRPASGPRSGIPAGLADPTDGPVTLSSLA